MAEISYGRHRFPPVIIQYAVWLYLRFTLSYRDVEELLAERGLDISYETVRCWVLKFGPVIARRLRRCRPPPAAASQTTLYLLGAATVLLLKRIHSRVDQLSRLELTPAQRLYTIKNLDLIDKDRGADPPATSPTVRFPE